MIMLICNTFFLLLKRFCYRFIIKTFPSKPPSKHSVQHQNDTAGDCKQSTQLRYNARFSYDSPDTTGFLICEHLNDFGLDISFLYGGKEKNDIFTHDFNMSQILSAYL